MIQVYSSFHQATSTVDCHSERHDGAKENTRQCAQGPGLQIQQNDTEKKQGANRGQATTSMNDLCSLELQIQTN